MSSPRPKSCQWCGSADVRKILWGMPAGDPGDEWFVGGCCIPPGPLPQFGCQDCGRVWSHVPLKIRSGEIVGTLVGPIRASQADLKWVRQIRAFLLEVVVEGRHIDAAEMKEQVEFPHDLDDVAPLLALVSEDCTRRGEPSLAAIVAGVPGADFGDEGTDVISQDEIFEILEEHYGRTVYLDDPDHPFRPS